MELSRDTGAELKYHNPCLAEKIDYGRVIGHLRMPVKRASRKGESKDVFGQARRRAKMFRAGMYARVSANDQQMLAMQNRAMREYAARMDDRLASPRGELGRGTAGSPRENPGSCSPPGD